MNPGDLVVSWYPEHHPDRKTGILLSVDVDQEILKKNRWGVVPWKYTVLWSNGEIKEHGSGSFQRIAMRRRR